MIRGAIAETQELIEQEENPVSKLELNSTIEELFDLKKSFEAEKKDSSVSRQSVRGSGDEQLSYSEYSIEDLDDVCVEDIVGDYLQKTLDESQGEEKADS